jgi:hypothetical protein
MLEVRFRTLFALPAVAAMVATACASEETSIHRHRHSLRGRVTCRGRPRNGKTHDPRSTDPAYPPQSSLNEDTN